MSRINPPVEEIEIGTRKNNVETLKIYPLSIADQLLFTDIIRAALQGFFGVSANSNIPAGDADSVTPQPVSFKSDLEFASFIMDLFKENLPRILTLVTDHTTEARAQKILSKLTNDQAVDIARLIYAMNYENASKNVMSLFKTVMGKDQEPSPTTSLKRPLPSSSNDTPNSDLNISSGSNSKTGD